MSHYSSFKFMMEPRSVAVVGASDNPKKVGHIILQNFIDMGYAGKIYPVNINSTGRIAGLKSYKSLRDIGESVDFVVIAVPAEVVPSVLDDCGAAKSKSVVVVSGGFAEVGSVELQRQLADKAKKYGFALLGPNCLGVMNMRNHVNTMFLPLYKFDSPKLGGVSFASQSGAVGSTVLDMVSNEGFGIAKFISYGNAVDLDEVDILDYLAHDPDTRVIIFYLEGVKRGREFLEAAKRTTKVKPVVVIKGGMSPAGASAVRSHTASLAGSYQAYEAAFRQSGIVQADSLDDLLDYAKIFETEPLSKGPSVAVITNGGGAGVLATDSIYDNRLVMPELEKETAATLRKAMPPIVNIRLPLDMAGDADDKRFEAALNAIGGDPNVDMIITIALFQTPGADSAVAASIINYKAGITKPLVVVSSGGSYTQAHRRMMESSNVPVYSSPEQAARALAALYKYSKTRGAIRKTK